MLMHALTPPWEFWRHRGMALAAGLATVLALGASAGAQDAAAKAELNRQQAIEIVKRMATFVGSEKDITLAYDSELEVVTPQMEKLQFNSSGKASLSRPDKFRVSRTGGYANVELIYDAKSLTVFDKDADSYAVEPATGSIDSVVERLRNEWMQDLPAADLLTTDSFDALMADVIEAKYIGPAVVGGVDCEHVAFRNHDTDWQLWVESGERPIPCKMVITSKTVGGAPQYSVQVTDWQSGQAFPADTFTFAPPSGAKKVEFRALANIDELPSGATAGESK